MNLPFILDIAIGLIFIYLILSLLASEIQELITTLLQWRAKHLKESIQNLLAGGVQKSDIATQVSSLTEKIYDDPLLKNINQEATGSINLAFRSVTWGISRIYRKLFSKDAPGTFGNKRSGPSYISSETFATTLLENLKIPQLVEKLVEARYEKFSNRILENILNLAVKAGKDLNSDENFQLLKEEFTDNVQDFKSKRSTLIISIDRMSESLDRYINSYPIPDEGDAQGQYFINRVKAMKLSLFGENNERAIISGGLQPTLTEIVEAINTSSQIHQEIQVVLGDPDSETYKTIAAAINHLPPSVRESLGVLARRAQTRVGKTENEISQLRDEVAIWFDRSMDRASGVYKRNAKGVAIIIGFLLAIVANADTFHIFNRLSSDESLRKVVTERASQINQQDLEQLKDQTNTVLADISLPVSWNPINVGQQFNCKLKPEASVPETVPQAKPNRTSTPSSANSASQSPPNNSWEQVLSFCLKEDVDSKALVPQKLVEIAFTHPIATIRILLGWFVSGIAIAMGAPFWFDLLGRVINVRNTGGKPPARPNPDRADAQ
jgi:hypothetical protein